MSNKSGKRYYVGAMSGTSIDGLDLALAECGDQHFELIATHESQLPETLTKDLHSLCSSPEQSLINVGELSVKFGQFIAEEINTFLGQQSVRHNQVEAIGSHGQTIFHQPDSGAAFTMQIGDGNTIAELTDIPCVTDFRMADIAAGGQGAPLAPAFHKAVFHSEHEDRVILNLGGISNLSVLSAKNGAKILGFDIGPANTLLDGWIRKHQNQGFDKDGQWARSGQPLPALLENMLKEPFFSRSYPKSTGRELFNMAWLSQHLATNENPADVQRTLLELTAQSIASTLIKLSEQLKLEPLAIYCCGGGAKNTYLMERLSQLMPSWQVRDTSYLGIRPDDVEAAAFAWLAYRRVKRLPGNLPSVTGAKREKILGAMYHP